MVNNYVSEEERAKILSSLKEDKVMASLLDRILFPPPTPKKVVDKVQKKEKKKKKETSDRKTTPKVSLEERQSSEVDHERCLCRLWKNGLDNVQCSRMKKEGDFCTAHSKVGADWWCGLITEPRPEEPCLPNKKDPDAPPSRHYWHDQEKPTKKRKTPVKKEKKERKVKKESPKKVSFSEEPEIFDESKATSGSGSGTGLNELVDNFSKDMDTILKDGATAISNVLSKDPTDEHGADDIPSDIDSDEEEPIDFDYEGVIYKRLPIDDMIVDRVTGRQMGYLIAGEMIDFIGPEEEQIHEKNKE
jgi:hypothetical protein